MNVQHIVLADGLRCVRLEDYRELEAEVARLREALERIQITAQGSADKVACLLTISAINHMATAAIVSKGETE